MSDSIFVGPRSAFVRRGFFYASTATGLAKDYAVGAFFYKPAPHHPWRQWGHVMVDEAKRKRAREKKSQRIRNERRKK